MSGERKDGDDSHEGTESRPIDKPEEAKKYPFQTTKRRNKAVKINLETTENLIERQSESKNEIITSKDTLIELSTPVVNEQIKTDQNLPEIVNHTHDQASEDSSLKIDPPESEELKSQLPHAVTKTLMENEVELDLIEVAEKRKKIRRQDLTKKELDEICKGRDGKGGSWTKTKTPGLDPRFQQQNQTMRCFVMYTDFYRCENILGEGELACQWFKDVFTSICPLDWIRRWDEAREEGRFGWPKGKTQGKFPGNRYGV